MSWTLRDFRFWSTRSTECFCPSIIILLLRITPITILNISDVICTLQEFFVPFYTIHLFIFVVSKRITSCIRIPVFNFQFSCIQISIFLKIFLNFLQFPQGNSIFLYSYPVFIQSYNPVFKYLDTITSNYQWRNNIVTY